MLFELLTLAVLDGLGTLPIDLGSLHLGKHELVHLAVATAVVDAQGLGAEPVDFLHFKLALGLHFLDNEEGFGEVESAVAVLLVEFAEDDAELLADEGFDVDRKLLARRAVAEKVEVRLVLVELLPYHVYLVGQRIVLS